MMTALHELMTAINSASLRYFTTQQRLSYEQRRVELTLQHYFSEVRQHLKSHISHASLSDHSHSTSDVDYTLEAFGASLYRNLCKAHHPDKHRSIPAKHEAMTRINTAYAEARQGKFAALLSCCHELYDAQATHHISADDMQHYYRHLSDMAEQMQQRYDRFKTSPRYRLAMRLTSVEILKQTARTVAAQMQVAA
jgi:regulator of sigma D